MRFEYWVLGFFGVMLGVPFSRYLSMAMNAMMETSGFSMPSTIPLNAYVTGIVGSAAAILLAGWSAKKKIGQFDMVEVLKERD